MTKAKWQYKGRPVDIEPDLELAAVDPEMTPTKKRIVDAKTGEVLWPERTTDDKSGGQ